jgi:hypothetical protein
MISKQKTKSTLWTEIYSDFLNWLMSVTVQPNNQTVLNQKQFAKITLHVQESILENRIQK